MTDMLEYLCYFEILVEGRTFYEHALVSARSAEEAFRILELQNVQGEHFSRKAKGVLGEATWAAMAKYLTLRPV